MQLYEKLLFSNSNFDLNLVLFNNFSLVTLMESLDSTAGLNLADKLAKLNAQLVAKGKRYCYNI